MASSQQFLVCDSSTFANYAQWASAISAQLAADTWIQTNDTGQIMWSGMNITAVSMSGTTMTCTYSAQTGLALAVGRALTVTGWTGGNTGNNGTFVITGGTLAAGSGTFIATNASGVNVASGGTGVVTIAAAAPGSAAYFYEIWTPNDGLTAFYMKLEYGNLSGTNSPSVRVTLGAGTNGSGTITGLSVGPTPLNLDAITPPSTITQYECDFSGGPGRFNFMLWRNAPSNQQQFMAVERSINASGTYVGTYVTVWYSGYSGGTPATTGGQSTLYFGVGTIGTNARATTQGGICARVFPASSAFNGTQAFDLSSPMVGFFDYPGTSTGLAWAGTLTEGVPFSTTVYGTTRTYMPSASGPFASCGPALNNYAQAVYILCMRYD